MRALTGRYGPRRNLSQCEISRPSKSRKLDEPMPWPDWYFGSAIPLASSPLAHWDDTPNHGHRVGAMKPHA